MRVALRLKAPKGHHSQIANIAGVQIYSLTNNTYRLSLLNPMISMILAPSTAASYHHFCILIITIILILHLTCTSAGSSSHEADDFAESGSYHILYCDADDGISSQAAYLQALLPTVWSYIQELLQDIILGTTSPHGYAAFFKTDANLDDIREVFQDIADGPDVLSRGAPGTVARWSAPTILCVNAGDSETYLLQASCRVNQPGSRKVAGVTRFSGIVHLCPQFFDIPRMPRRGACPRVDATTNRFEENNVGLGLAKTQYAVLVHELTHIYLTARGVQVQQEVYDIQGAVDLNASASFENAQNFAYYAAGESTKWIGRGTRMRCDY